MTNNLVIVAGGGIGGLATALTLNQIGVPCIVFEAVREMAIKARTENAELRAMIDSLRASGVRNDPQS